MKKGFSKTLLNTILYIGIAMLLLVVSLSAALNVIIEKEGLKTMQESNAVLLSEVAYHVSYMHQVNLALCRMEFNDSDVQGLLTAKGQTDIFASNNIINRLRKSMIANGMVDSVMLYNGVKDEYYYTDSYLYRYDKEMIELLRTDRGDENVFMISRVLNVPDSRKVLSYVMVSRFAKDNSIESAVVVNVSANWMLYNLAVGDASRAKLMLVDDRGELVLDTEGITDEYKLDKETFSHILNGNGNNFIQIVDGKKRVVSYLGVEDTNWYLVNSQPYSTLYGMVEGIRSKMLLLVFLSLAVALVITVMLAKIVTNPWILLTKRIQMIYGKDNETREENNSNQKEADFLLNVFEDQQKQISKYEDYREGTENALYKSYLKNTLLENGTGVYPPSDNLNKKSHNLFAENEKVYMVLLAISNLQNLSDENVTERNLIRFVVCNIADEVLGRYGKMEVLPMSSGEVVVLLGREEHNEDFCRKCLNEVLENTSKIIDITLSAFVEGIPYTQSKLAACYKHLRTMSRYTLIYGVGCILFNAEMDIQGKKALEYPQELEKRILLAMNESNEIKAGKEIRGFLLYLGEGSVESYLACVHKLFLSLQTYVGKMNQNRLIKINADLEGILAQLRMAETSEQVYQFLYGIVQNILVQMPTSAVQKNDALIKGVKQYVENHYSSKELCGKQLAGEFGLSTAYLGMLFKDAMGTGVQEYINGIRLEHAKEMVLNTNLLISEIMELCGFETSSFYRLYKVYFGVSPKEQRMQKRLLEK